MDKNQNTVNIIGAGLAGSEAAWQLAERGFKVNLYEMRGLQPTPAHKTDKAAELVCSNSFGSQTDYSAPGQLKKEAKQLGSMILSCAESSKLPAGMALAVDREKFSALVTQKLEAHENINIVRKHVNSIDDLPRPLIVATGPLTSDSLSKSMKDHFNNQFLYFYDAISPIVDTDTIDMSVAYLKNRYDDNEGDYINCPLDKIQYENLINAINGAAKVEPKEFEKDVPYFEGCMPIEVMASRGLETLRHGPMSPKGLRSPHTGQSPYAIVQLRKDNIEGTAYNIVGFQTKMTYGAQKEIIRMIPGLTEVEFFKLGSIHKNLYINSPLCLNKDLSSSRDSNLYFAGQITGVEGYFESTCIGLLVAIQLAHKLNGSTFELPPQSSCLGALLKAITTPKEGFQPTNINFGLLPKIEIKMKKRDKRDKQIAIAQENFSLWQNAKFHVPTARSTQIEV